VKVNTTDLKLTSSGGMEELNVTRFTRFRHRDVGPFVIIYASHQKVWSKVTPRNVGRRVRASTIDPRVYPSELNNSLRLVASEYCFKWFSGVRRRGLTSIRTTAKEF
jgi:hypothetical protein